MRTHQSYLRPYSKPFSPKPEKSSFSGFPRTGKLADREVVPSLGVHTMESQESCLYAEPDRFHGEKCVGKRGDLQA